MFNLKNRSKKGFTTVEILVAVGLVAILMVVAVPRLLGTRQSVGDSAAKQQLTTVGVAVNNWYVERDTFKGLTDGALKNRVPEVQIVTGAAGKATDGRALSVGLAAVPADGSYAIIYASNGDNNCWAVQYSKWGAWYNYARTTTCNNNTFSASSVAAVEPEAGKGWKRFEFPNAAE
jgi:type II secretory pathway pseudopilin PulG